MGALKCESLANYFDREGIDPNGFTIRPVDPFDLRADKVMSRAVWSAHKNARCDSLNLENTEFWEKVWAAGDRENEKLAALVAPVDSGTTQLAIRRISDITTEKLKWLWPGRIPLGKNSMLVGDPGLGKSMLTLDMAARVSRGAPWPIPGEGKAPLGDVILVSAEDDPSDTIRPRLEAAGADLTRCHFLDGKMTVDDDGRATILPWTLTDIVILEAALEKLQECRMIVVDPISAYLASQTDSHKNSDVRAALAPISALAAAHAVSVLMVSHLNKSQSGPAIYRTTGSLAFTAAARAVYAVTKDRQNKARRLMLPLKSNLAPDANGLAFQIGTTTDNIPIIRWEPELVKVDADDVLAAGADSDVKSQITESIEWLVDALADGPRPAGELKSQAKIDGISEKSLRQARKILHGTTYKNNFSGGWMWALPKAAHEGGPAPRPENTSAFAAFGRLGDKSTPYPYNICAPLAEGGEGGSLPGTGAEQGDPGAPDDWDNDL